jgi:transcriptional regulator with XRE-family HTH domain
MTHSPWALMLTQRIGAEVRGHRMQRKMTVQALADRCAELGLPLSRVTLTKMERGTREHVSVPELLILGAALEVAPLELVLPSNRRFGVAWQPEREILPRQFMRQREAVRWFAGIVDDPLLEEVRGLVGQLAKLVGGGP